jgi:hypothetical protein
MHFHIFSPSRRVHIFRTLAMGLPWRIPPCRLRPDISAFSDPSASSLLPPSLSLFFFDLFLRSFERGFFNGVGGPALFGVAYRTRSIISPLLVVPKLYLTNYKKLLRFWSFISICRIHPFAFALATRSVFRKLRLVDFQEAESTGAE